MDLSTLMHAEEVLADLAHERRKIPEVVEAIRNGEYKIRVGRKGVYDPLLTEDEKELFTR